MQQTAMQYIASQKIGTLSEIAALSKEDRERLKQMAVTEAKALGIELKE